MSEGIFRAVNTIADAMKDLTPEEQQRTLDAVYLLLGFHAPQPQKAEPARVAGASSAKPISIVEFMKEKKPSNAKEYIATFALYLQEIEGRETFASAELRACFEKAKLKNPGPNFGRDFAKSQKAGWIAGNSEKCYLTQAGQRAVESQFSEVER